jgi:hypothetical protein
MKPRWKQVFTLTLSFLITVILVKVINKAFFPSSGKGSVSFNCLKSDQSSNCQTGNIPTNSTSVPSPQINPTATLNNANNLFDFKSLPRKEIFNIDGRTIIMGIGGKPGTIHAPTRTSVAKIIKDTGATIAVDGTFFSLKYLNSNTMIGPVLSQNEQVFIPGNNWDISKIAGRPLVLISANWVKFIPFDPQKHNSMAGIQSESTDGSPVTDAFVAGAWLVKNSLPQPAKTFRDTHLYAFDIARHRAFWGINQAGQPVVGLTTGNIDSVGLGKILAKLGLRDIVMVDSGDSADIVYQGKSQTPYNPRPVPHVVALYPANSNQVSPTSSPLANFSKLP